MKLLLFHTRLSRSMRRPRQLHLHRGRAPARQAQARRRIPSTLPPARARHRVGATAKPNLFIRPGRAGGWSSNTPPRARDASRPRPSIVSLAASSGALAPAAASSRRLVRVISCPARGPNAERLAHSQQFGKSGGVRALGNHQEARSSRRNGPPSLMIARPAVPGPLSGSSWLGPACSEERRGSPKPTSVKSGGGRRRRCGP